MHAVDASLHAVDASLHAVDAWAMNDVQYKSKFIIGQKLTSGENLNTENYVFG